MKSRVGRIALDRVFIEWSENWPLNPRLLAVEVADAIRSISQQGLTVSPNCVSVIEVAGAHSTPNTITMWAVADYFVSLGAGKSPRTIVTAHGDARPNTVFLARHWIDRLANEATERSVIATGLAQAAKVNSVEVVTEPLSGSDPVCLAMRQEQLQQEAGRSLHEQLEQERSKYQEADQELTRLRAENTLLTAYLQDAQEQAELYRRELNENTRAKNLLEDQLYEERAANRQANERADKAETLARAAIESLPKHLSKLVPEVVALNNLARSLGITGTPKSPSVTPEKGWYLIVAALMELLFDRVRPSYNQGSAAKAIAEKGWRGLGERQVNGIFAFAKKVAKEARKEAMNKAESIQDNNKSQHEPS